MRILSLATTILAAIALPCTLPLALSAQRTIRVPAEAGTIQAAINSSTNGDTVLVAPGTYRENIDFRGKNITVTSSAGAPTTILDGGGTAPVATFASGEANLATLSGFTIRNGSGPTSSMNGGGGVFIHYASPTIQNNVFTDNACTAINVQGSPVITGNTIMRTHTFSPAIQCEYPGSPILVFGSSRVRIAGNTITDNTEAVLGAILIWLSEDTVIENNVIRNNAALPGVVGAGAISTFNSSTITIDGNEISGNMTGGSSSASAIELRLVDLSLPGKLPLGAPLISILNNTIADNGSASQPQVLLDRAHARIQVVNNIVSSSVGAPGFDCRLNSLYASQGNVPIFVTNDSFGAGTPFDPACSADAAHGNINTDPLLAADASGHLVPHAPGPVDNGSNSVLPQPATDLEGNIRAQSALPVRIDMGAIETRGTYQQQHRLIAAPSRYSTSSGSITVTYAYVVSDATGLYVDAAASLWVDGVMAQTQNITINNAPPAHTGSFSAQLSPGTHEVQVRLYVGTDLVAASIPTRVDVDSSTTDLNPAALVIMNIDPLTAIGSRVSTQVRCRLTQPLSGRMRIFDNGNLRVDTIPNGTADVYATFFADPGPHQYQCDFESTAFNDSVVGSQIVAKAAASVGGLYSLPDPSEYGDPVTIGGGITPYDPSMNGHIRITEGSTVILDSDLDSTGAASITTTTLTPGLHSFDGVITSTSGNVTNTSGIFRQTVHFAPTAIALTAGPTTGTPATPIVLTTTATSSYKGAALTGAVDILDNGVKLASPGTLNGNTTMTFGAGTHVLTAVLNGSAIFAPSTSNAVTVVITAPPPPPPPDFSITPANPTLSVQTEHHATVALTLNSINSFSGPVHLTCGPLPPVATCTFDKSTYALSSTAAVTLVLETSAIPGYKSQLESSKGTIAICILPAALLLLTLRRKRVMALAALLALAGCSSKYPDHTPPGTYTITITATGTSGPTTITHSVPLRLTVIPE